MLALGCCLLVIEMNIFRRLFVYGNMHVWGGGCLWSTPTGTGLLYEDREGNFRVTTEELKTQLQL